MTNCCWPFKFVAILLSCLFAFPAINGQTSSSNQSSALNAAITYFNNEIGEDAHLYTGKEYSPYEKGIKGHPFFESPEMESNSIFYDGILYTNIPLLFDIVRQEVVINRYKQDVRIKLLSEKIKYFTFSGHRFENMALTGGKDESTSTGIYDIVFNGKVKVLIKRFKRIKNSLKAEDPPAFVEEDEFFIRNGTRLFAVDNKGSLLDALKDKKDLIKTFTRKNKFRFKKNIEMELKMATAYYSTLNS
ncbi:MAG: hypothetical protein ABI416_18540 [Ginsengibacter sp.]